MARRSGAVALDIETVPLPSSGYTPQQEERLQSEMEHRRRRPNGDAEADRRLACSTHPMLGWICCVALATWKPLSSRRLPRRPSNDPPTRHFVAAGPSEESRLLEEVWRWIGQAGTKVQWVTFNGKQFDVPFLQMRSMARGITPPQSGLNNTYPYAHEPHADLMKVWPSTYYTLDQLCGHLGVASPKQEVDGGDVAQLVEDGKLGAVARYGEADAAATLECWKTLRPLLDVL